MRYLSIGFVIVALAVVLLFMAQNFTLVTIQLFSMSATMPLAMLAILVYLLGMLTGGAVWSLLRSSFRNASARKA